MSANPSTVRGNVLVVSNWPRGVVVQAAERCGFSTDVVRDVSEAVLNLGRRRYRAVLADLDRSNVDCLELVLNVRDFDPAVPIAVLASEWVMADLTVIGTQSGTMLVAKSDRVSDMSNELARLPLLEKSEVTAAS
jgi:DNA-binding response OmpR family regulator